MRFILSLIIALLTVSPVFATMSSDRDQNLIIPGQRIGPVRLGMNRAAISKVNRDALCPVLAIYDAAGRAVRLETNWGGGCLLSDKIQVGLPFEPVLRTFGKPDQVTQDGRYPHATANWLSYHGWGVAFRVLVWTSGTIIQSIAVFPGVDARLNCILCQGALDVGAEGDRR